MIHFFVMLGFDIDDDIGRNDMVIDGVFFYVKPFFCLYDTE